MSAQVPVGLSPQAIAVNPVTNKTYVANTGSDTLTIIDGATGNPTFLGIGKSPSAIAINTVTNKIYVADAGGVELDVIDGSTNAITPVLVGYHPESLAVNPVTNKVYVANAEGDSLTVVDGATNATATIATGTTPRAVAVNPVTNKIYVANWSSNSVTVIDGASGLTSTVAVGTNPRAITVNSVTNQIYVANYGSNTVTDIDGTTANTSTIAAGANPYAIAVNEVNNQIYVANYATATVTLINGTTNATTALPVGNNPGSLTINQDTNQVYVACQSSSSLFMIDGATSQVTSLPVGGSVLAVAVNPITNYLYVANDGGNSFSTNNVAFIDASNNSLSAPELVGYAITAINPVNGNLYLTKSGSNVTLAQLETLYVFNPVTNVITPVSIGTPYGPLAINAATNKIYLLVQPNNPADGGVAVIDGNTNRLLATVTLGTISDGIGINSASNIIYVSSSGGATNTTPSVAIIDGASNTVAATLSGLYGPPVVNPVTNKAYLGGPVSGTLAVIDGESSTYTTIMGTPPIAGFGVFAVNPVTDKIYGCSSGTLYVVDGATTEVSTYAGLGQYSGTGTCAVTLNPSSNKVYVTGYTYQNEAASGEFLSIFNANNNHVSTIDLAGSGSADVPIIDQALNRLYFEGPSGASIMDGATDAFRPTGENIAVALVDPLTSKAYAEASAPNTDYALETLILTPSPNVANPVIASVTPLSGNATSSASPSFHFTTSSTYAPIAPPVQNVYYQLDTQQGSWIPATGTAPNFTATLASVPLGTHILYYYAADGSDSTDLAIGQTNVGAVSAYTFTIVTP